jgi:hypothetical protein
MTKDETLLVFTLVVSLISVFLFGILLFMVLISGIGFGLVCKRFGHRNFTNFGDLTRPYTCMVVSYDL